MKQTKFVKQAKLPRDAYDVDFIDSVAFFRKAEDKVYCQCHPLNSYNPQKYKACYECYRIHYRCCEQREANI